MRLYLPFMVTVQSDFQKWNDRIARSADGWARNCAFEHRSQEIGSPTNIGGIAGYESLGENLAVGSEEDPRWTESIDDIQVVMQQVIVQWFDENRDFQWPITCAAGRECGHFVQVSFMFSRLTPCYFAFFFATDDTR